MEDIQSLENRLVKQTKLGISGNCFSACLATVLGLKIDDVPNFFDVAGSDHEAWWKAVRAWLKPRGYGIICISVSSDLLYMLDGIFIVSGPSPRLAGESHATVWYGRKHMHDPHPDNTGLSLIESIDLLYPLDPTFFNTSQGAIND